MCIKFTKFSGFVQTPCQSDAWYNHKTNIILKYFIASGIYNKVKFNNTFSEILLKQN